MQHAAEKGALMLELPHPSSRGRCLERGSDGAFCCVSAEEALIGVPWGA